MEKKIIHPPVHTLNGTVTLMLPFQSSIQAGQLLLCIQYLPVDFLPKTIHPSKGMSASFFLEAEYLTEEELCYLRF